MAVIRLSFFVVLLLPALALGDDFEKGLEAMKAEDYDLAIACFDAALQTKPKSVALYNNRGLAYFRKKQHDKAIRDFSEAIRLDPTDPSRWWLRGRVYAEQKQHDKAISDFNEAIRVAPKDHCGYANLAWLLATCPKEEVRNSKKALDLATKACELTKKKDAFCLSALAAALAETGDFKEAVKLQNKVMRLVAGDEEEMDEASAQMKRYEQGKPYRSE